MGLYKKTLILITSQFPYGKGEEYLETEIEYLSAHFEEIFILPRLINVNSKIKKLPRNVSTSRVLCVPPPKVSNFSYFTITARAFFLFFKVLLVERNFRYLKEYSFIFSRIKKEIQEMKEISHFLHKNQLKGCSVYCYWAFGNILSICLLKKNKLISKAVCRCHGFDLYDERWRIGFVPFRRMLSQYFDSIHTVSNFGENYLKKRISSSFYNKVQTSYLGTDNSGEGINQNKNLGSVMIVSCSSLMPLKRVELIPQLLKHIDIPLTWVHFGDGETRQKILVKIRELKDHINCEIRGETKNEDILTFYKNSYITCFLSLSSSEGLPYSMIEAISFGIPIVACNVGGVSEIVNNKTGILLNPNAEIINWIEPLKKIITGQCSYDRLEITQFQREKFSAEKNYKKFIENHLY